MATGGATLPRLESWQVMHETPYEYPISKDICTTLFHDVGINESGMQNYFAMRAKNLAPNAVVGYDSTTMSTYSETQREARHGHNKDGSNLKVIKHVVFFSLELTEPIAFAKQPGNISDMSSVLNAIKQVKCLGLIKPMLVMVFYPL